MTIEDKLRKLINTRYGNMKAFAKYADIKYSTLAAIMKRGVMNSTIDSIFALCDALNISVDALIKGNIIEYPKYDYPEDLRVNDLPDLIDAYVSYFEKNFECTLDHVPLTTEEMDFFISSVNLIFDQLRAKRFRKEQEEKQNLDKENKE